MIRDGAIPDLDDYEDLRDDFLQKLDEYSVTQGQHPMLGRYRTFVRP